MIGVFVRCRPSLECRDAPLPYVPPRTACLPGPCSPCWPRGGFASTLRRPHFAPARTAAPPHHGALRPQRLAFTSRPACPTWAARCAMRPSWWPTEGRSSQGRTLYARDVVAPQARLRVLVVGAMHGDEMSSASVALHWIQHALKEPADAHWRFIPVLNPDGLLARPAKPRERARRGPQPQLSHAELGQRCQGVLGATHEERTRAAGPAPARLSEPESRFLHEEMARFQPHLIVSIHAPYGVLDFDGPGAPPPKLGRLYLDQVGIFPGQPGQLRWRAPGHAGGHDRTGQRLSRTAGQRDASDVAWTCSAGWWNACVP